MTSVTSGRRPAGQSGRQPSVGSSVRTEYDANHYARQWQKPEEIEKDEAARQRSHESHLMLVTQPDNAGRQQWRARRTATAFMMLPPDFKPDQQEQCFQAQTSRRTDLLADKFPELFQVVREHAVQVELFPITNRNDPQGRRIIKLNIFGPITNAELAKKDMQKVIGNFSADGKSAGAKKFPKVNPKSLEQRALEDKNFENYMRAREFCKEPAEDAAFARCATFAWPIDSIKAKPQEILGNSFEALDPIRMEQLCHITCDRSRWLFKIQGNDALNIKEAVKRLRAVYYQVVARNVHCETQYLKQPRGALSKPEVELLSVTDPKVGMLKKPVGRGKPPEVDLMDSTDDVGNKKLGELKKQRLNILDTLSRLHYYNGSLSLRFRLGTFRLSKYKRLDRPMSRDEFDDMMDESGREGDVSESFENGFTQEGLLSGKVPKSLHIQPAKYFAPDDADGTQSKQGTLSDAWATSDEMVIDEKRRYYEPELSFTLFMKDKDGPVKLVLDYTTDINGYLDKQSIKWSMGQERKDRKLFDLNFVNVDDDIAWSFELTASHTIGEERLLFLNQFLEKDRLVLKTDPKVRLDPNNADLLLALKPLGGLAFTSIHQRKTWTYSILPGDFYQLELTLVQPFRAGPIDWATTKFALMKEEPYWTVHISSSKWKEKLSRNGQLSIGEHADWSMSSQDLFPSSGPHADGFVELVTRVERLAVALKDCTIEVDAATGKPSAKTPSKPGKQPNAKPDAPPSANTASQPSKKPLANADAKPSVNGSSAKGSPAKSSSNPPRKR